MITDWQEIGVVGTDVSTFAIVDPSYARDLAKLWRQRVKRMDVEPFGTFEPLELGEPGLLVDPGGVDGEWKVEARFCDTFAEQGRIDLCELRIRFCGCEGSTDDEAH
jgi:hypothetical protein